MTNISLTVEPRPSEPLSGLGVKDWFFIPPTLNELYVKISPDDGTGQCNTFRVNDGTQHLLSISLPILHVQTIIFDVILT